MTKLQQQLAEQFLHILEEEKLDWKKEWSGLSGRPYNPVSKTVYHGSNYFSLLLTSMAKGYQDTRILFWHSVPFLLLVSIPAL